MAFEKTMIRVLIKHTSKLLDKGNRCPTVDELLKPVKKHPKFRDDNWRWKRELLQILRLTLFSQYQICVCSVSEVYYSDQYGKDGVLIRKSFKEVPPTTPGEAIKCLTTGPLPVAGLYFPQSPTHDLIYMAYVEKYTERSSHLVGIFVGHGENGVDKKVLNRKKTDVALKRAMKEGTGKLLTPMLERLVQMQAETMSMIKKLSDK